MYGVSGAMTPETPYIYLILLADHQVAGKLK
jgi:hypothetical protein